MAKDMLGNELHVGDKVMMALDRPLAFGDILEIKEGGLITGTRRGATEARPGVILVLCRFDTPFDPTNPIIGNMVRIYDPTPKPEGEEPAPSPSKLLTM